MSRLGKLIQTPVVSLTETSGSSTAAGLVEHDDRTSSTLLQMKTAGADFSSATAGLEGTALMIGDGALSLHGCFEVEWAKPQIPHLWWYGQLSPFLHLLSFLANVKQIVFDTP